MSSRRWLVMAVLVGLVGPGAMAVEAAGRPAGTGKGETVGTVLWVVGGARVKPTVGAEFAAAQGVPLYRTDEITAGSRGFVLVDLNNGYLARIDEEITLGVGDIALIDAPNTSVSAQDQLQRLMSSAEFQSLGQRVVGARAGKSGAEVVAPQTYERAPAVTERRKAMKEAPPPPGAPAPVSPAPARVPLSREEPAQAGLKGEAAGFKKLDAELALEDKGPGTHRGPMDTVAPRKPAPPADLQWSRVTGKTTSPLKGPMPPAFADEIRGLSSCFASDQALSLAHAAARFQLFVRVEDGKVALVRRAGGLAAPACADRLLGRSVPGQKGWLVVEVPRP